MAEAAATPVPQAPIVSAGGPLLAVEDLVVEFDQSEGRLVANDHVSIAISRGETLGLVGESGSGKSILCRTILRLVPSPPARIAGGRVLFEGEDLLTVSDERMRELRGTDIAMIFQNPMTSLNPVWPIGDQVTEGLRIHRGIGERATREAGIALLQKVGISSPELRIDEYPHQWSGGMLQRAVVAMAMACAPKLLLADEPTTALDVTIQDQILALLMELQRDTGMALVLVSHDLAVVAETSDRVVVMYAGRIVEVADTADLFGRPRHPYTLGLIASIPNVAANAERLVPISGQPPNLTRLPPGCAFAPRCPYASEECRRTNMTLREVAPRHFSACLFPERIAG